MQLAADLWLQTLPGAYVVAPRGPIDLADAPPLRELLGALLTDGTATWLICDLDGLNDIDAVGLGVLIRTHHLASRNHRQFCITGGAWQVRRSLDRAGLRERLTHYPTRAGALHDAAELTGSLPLPSAPHRRNTTHVDEAEERHAIHGVTDRLHKRFPGIEPQVIEATVEDVFSTLREAPIRNFLPMLVEREARERLRASQQQ